MDDQFEDLDDDFLSSIPLDDESLNVHQSHTPSSSSISNSYPTSAGICSTNLKTHTLTVSGNNYNVLQPVNPVNNIIHADQTAYCSTKTTETKPCETGIVYSSNSSPVKHQPQNKKHAAVNLLSVQGSVTAHGGETNPVDPNVENTDQQLPVPTQFAFPFEPYDIQVGFMQSLYKAIDGGKVGIFESPTGTGKSLSLICGALRWLQDFEEKQRRELEELLAEQAASIEETKQAEKKGELDWITAFAKKKEDDEKAKKLEEERVAWLKKDTRLKELRSKVKRPRTSVKRKRDKLEEEFDELFKGASEELKNQFDAEMTSHGDGDHGDEADENLLAEYVSDDEKSATEEELKGDDDKDDDDHVTKIYYCSRTHSQIAQFVREVMKSPYGADTRVVSLGSRQNLCINEAVRRLRHMSLINDRCLELQKNKSGKKKEEEQSSKRRRRGAGSAGSCLYYKQDPMLQLKDSILKDLMVELCDEGIRLLKKTNTLKWLQVEIKDIEQLVSQGRELQACPYYGTRYAIPAAQIVALPYNTLLHRSTRKSCGIRLAGNVVVIDEAHNLLDTISSVHSVQVTGGQVTCAHSQLSQYLTRYQSRLKAKNLMYIRQLLFILASLLKCLGGQTGVPAEEQKLARAETKLQTINDFLFATQLDNLNLFKILHYCEKSQIAKKLHGFVEKYQPSFVAKRETTEDKPSSSGLTSFLKQLSERKHPQDKAEEKAEGGSEAGEPSTVTMSSPLLHITAFLQALTTADKDGRIVVSKQELLSGSCLKFLLLNPAIHFAEVLREARAVIVAGGTMQPLSEFKNQLFFAAGVSPERILEYSCGHVITEDHLLPVALARGPSGHLLDFTYQSRDTPQTLDELGRVVYNVCHVVPGGVVVFFPSYDYERLVHAHWHRHGFLDKIQAKKKIFREPKKSNQVDSVLAEYSTCIKKHLGNKYSALTGAALFCVVGGKMSEGINFSDDLGRCVIMVGLPYPNIKSPELKEKMDYLNANMPRGADGKLPGQVHYENLCMKAVNQSIGRAIRHKGDYASIVLADHRYLKPSMKPKLPSWIAGSLKPIDRFGPAFAELRKFFSTKRTDEDR